ncbi:MAG: hypothetical protein AAFR61_20545 [Bacteroidota bacterium]
MATSLPLHRTDWTRVHKLNGPDSAVADISQFWKRTASLVILGDFVHSPVLVKSANRLCLNGPEFQRVLWVKDESLMNAIVPGCQALIEAFQPGMTLDKVQAFSVNPQDGSAVFLIEKQPANPNERISTPRMLKAFNAVLQLLPPDWQPPVTSLS